jgi:hypothetical protein
MENLRWIALSCSSSLRQQSQEGRLRVQHRNWRDWIWILSHCRRWDDGSRTWVGRDFYSGIYENQTENISVIISQLEGQEERRKNTVKLHV